MCAHCHPLGSQRYRDNSFVSNVQKQRVSAGVQKTQKEMQGSGESGGGGGGSGGGGGVYRKTTTDISGNFTGMANPM